MTYEPEINEYQYRSKRYKSRYMDSLRQLYGTEPNNGLDKHRIGLDDTKNKETTEPREEGTNIPR